MASPTGSAGPSQSSSKADRELQAGTIKKIGKYEIQKKIGAGGMGAVYLALDPFLKRNCALKVLPHEKAKNPTLVKRFQAEAEQAAKLRHENIVAIYEAGEADGFLYIALEYVDGTDVANLVQKRGLISLKRSIEIVKQASLALEHAQQQGIVHRDIKPGNLLVRRDGVVKLADMGLARSLDDVDTAITRAGTTVGTVDYMAPEQARDSKAADVRSDIYALGCTWYYMLTGQPPYTEGTITNKLRAHAETPLPDPRVENPSVTEAVLGIMRRMTEKKPADRYQTPKELLEDLERGSLSSSNFSDTILEELGDDGLAFHGKRRDDDDEAPTDDWGSGRRRVKPAETAEVPVDDRDDIPDPWSRHSKKKKKDSKRADRDDAASAHDLEAGEEEERPSRIKPPRRAAEKDDGPAFKPPPGRDPKDKQKLLEPSKPLKNNAALFYALVGLAVFGVVATVIWAVGEYSNSANSASDRMANPFANRDDVAQQAGPAANAGAPVAGSGGAAQGAASAQPGSATVGPTNVGIGPETTTIGPNAPGYDPGRLTTRIGGDVPGSDAETGSAGNSVGGNSVGSSNTDGSSTQGTALESPVGTRTTVIGTGASSQEGSSTSGSREGPSAATSQRGRAASQQSAARIAQETAALPAWAREPRPADALPLLTVRSGASGQSTFATLNKALESAPAGGARIHLVGSGPFPLFPVQIAGKTRIVIEPHDASESGDEPVILLLPPEEGSASNFIEVNGTALELRKLHLVLDASEFSTEPDDAMLSAVSSDLFLQNCSFSVKGKPAGSMTAVKVSGKVSRPDAKAGSRPRIYFDQTLVRGNNLTALTVNGEHLDLASRGSLFWSGAAPAVRFGSVARSDADSERTLRLISTTLCALRTAIQLGPDASQPVPTAFELVNTLVAAPAGSDPAVLVDLDGWNSAQLKTAGGKLVTWKSTSSLYTGWTTLLQLNPGAIPAATTLAQWQSTWKEKDAGEKEQFQSSRWPARSVSDIATADLGTFIPQTIGKQYVKTEGGGWPGCAPERLATVNLDALAAARVSASRPSIPLGMFDLKPRDVIRIDVTKQDLGKVLDGKRLATGTTVIVSGSGTRQSSPIVIENAWIRMQFEPTEGAPLVLTPRSAESKLDGFITVRNGGLLIDRGVFSIPSSERAALPRWFIQVVDGDLGLFHCRLHGPLNGAGRNKGLIRWQTETGRAPARLFEGRYDGYMVVQSSYLIGSGTLIDADMRRRAMIFHNSVVVSRDDLCALAIDGPDSEIDAAVDVRYSTLSAADRFFQVRGGEPGVAASTPLAIYADRSVFAPPLRSGTGKPNPTLLAWSGSVFDRKQLVWWENRCGHAPEITTYLRADSDESKAAQDFGEKWVKVWGADQVLEALTGVNGVVLKKELPTKADERMKLEPEDFELLPSCRASTWEGGKQPIGAYIATMQLPPLRAPPAPPAEKKKPARATPAAPKPASGF